MPLIIQAVEMQRLTKKPHKLSFLFKKSTPSQINLIKNVKNIIFIIEKEQNTASAQLWERASQLCVESQCYLAVCNVCFPKTLNYIEVQKYLFGINGELVEIVFSGSNVLAVCLFFLLPCAVQRKCAASL